MSNVVEKPPKQAYAVHIDIHCDAHLWIEGFEPELPPLIWWSENIADEETGHTPAEIQQILDRSRLILNTSNGIGSVMGDVLSMSSHRWVSPAFRDLVEELEPGRQRYFPVTVVSKEPVAGKTEHGTYYWLCTPPLVDCLRFPETWMLADVHGDAWSKDEDYWGGGVSASEPAFVDAAAIEGHHFWLTRQSNRSGVEANLLTWSERLMAEFRRRGMAGWTVDKELGVIFDQ